MKSSSIPWARRVLIVLASLIAGAVIASPFFIHSGPNGKALSMISTHDMVQHFAVMKDFDKVLRSGTLYPRWLPDINNGYGIPWMNYYPPGFYFAASLVNSLVNNWVVTLFVIAALGFAASGLAFYWLAQTFYGPAASAIAALFYMLLPYHVINLYWQGAMPQLLGFIFLPLTLLFAWRVATLGRPRDFAGLGLFYGTYLMTHAPVSFLMSYTLALYAIVSAYRSRDWKIALRVAMGMGIGLMLGAIYWLPAVLETKDIQEHFTAVFPYHNSYITLMPLQGFGNLINQSFVLQTLVLIAAALVLRDIAKSTAQPRKAGDAQEPISTPSSQTKLWIVLGIVTTFMCTSFSIYVSKLLPKIQVATFAWRWLAISNLFVALIVAATLDRLRGSIELSAPRVWAYRAIIAALIVWNVFVTVQGVVYGALANPPFDPHVDYVEAGFTPKNSTAPQILPKTDLATIQPDSGAVEVIRWDPSHRVVVARVDQPSELRLKSYNFPGWSARVDGGTVPIASDKDGVQLISLPPGRHQIETDFGDTLPRSASKVLFGIGLALIVGLAAIELRKRIDERKEQLLAEGKSRGGPNRRTVLVGGIVAAAVIIAAIIVARTAISGRKGNDGNVSDKSGTSPKSPSRGNLQAGSEASLYVNGLDSIPVAVDEPALAELMTEFPAGRGERVEALVRAGKVFRVDNNTRVRILEVGSAKLKIRVLEGGNLTLEGWVPERWVR